METPSSEDPRVPESPRRSWFFSPDFAFPLLLVLCWVGFFSDLLFSSKNFYYRDILNFHYPLRKVLIQAFARGELPLWNPFVNLGQPMLANPNYMAFYPTNLLHLFLSFNNAFKFHFILHPIAAGLGMYFLLRRLKVMAPAAFAGALGYQYSGITLSFLNLYNILPAVALLPWMAWAFTGAMMDCWRRRTLLFGLLLALQVIAFEPFIFQCALWFVAGLALSLALDSQDRLGALFRMTRTAGIGGLLALTISAAQLLPTLELLPLSARGAGYDFTTATGWSLHPMDLLNTFLPNLFGSPYTIDQAAYWGEAFHDSREGYLVSFFMGSSVLLVALLSFASRRQYLRRVMLALVAVSCFMALGHNNILYHWLYEHLAFFRFGRFPSKYFLLTALAVSVLAALGIEDLLRPVEATARVRKRFVPIAALGLIVSLVLFGCWAYASWKPAELEGWVRSMTEPNLTVAKNVSYISSQVLKSIRATGLYLFMGGALIGIACFWRRPRVVGGLLTLLVAAELIPANLSLSPLLSDMDVDYVPPVNAFLRDKGTNEPFRVVPTTTLRATPSVLIRAPNRSSAWLTLFFRRSGLPMYGIMNGIQYSLDISVDHLATRESNDLHTIFQYLQEPVRFTLLQKLNSPILLSFYKLEDERARLLASFETSSDWKLQLYWLESVAPRGYFVSGVTKVSTHAKALERLIRSDFPFGHSVILEESGIPEREGERGAGVVRILEYQNQNVVCEVEAKTDGYLVLLDSYFPGWRAEVDGHERTILNANYAFRAVPVPAGKHTVEFRYRPRSVYLGFWISALGLIAGAVMLLWPPRGGEAVSQKN